MEILLNDQFFKTLFVILLCLAFFLITLAGSFDLDRDKDSVIKYDYFSSYAFQNCINNLLMLLIITIAITELYY